MAKLAYTKLGLKLPTETKKVSFNEQEIEVKQFLPINEQLKMITEVLELVADQQDFYNELKYEVYFKVKMIEYYTNITFTDKQKEDVTKLYDAMASNGLFAEIVAVLPEAELGKLYYGGERIIKEYFAYKNSVYGILDSIKTDYNMLDLDAAAIQEKLADPNNMEFLKEVLGKLG